MTNEEAIKILELNSNFTESELKSKYRKLTKKYHPDLHSKASDEEKEEFKRKSQQIIAAYELLKKRQNRGSINTSNDIEYARQVIASYIVDCGDKRLEREIIKVANIIMQRIVSQEITKAEGIEKFKEELKSIYSITILKYAEKYKLPLFLIKETEFNYNCNSNVFITQLNNCLYNVENKINEAIKEIILSYKNNKFYKHIKESIIKKIITGIMNQIMHVETTEEEYYKCLKILNTKIRRLLNNYQKVSELIDKLDKMLTPEEKRNLSNNLKKAIEKNEFDELYRQVVEAIFQDIAKDYKEEIRTKLSERYNKAVSKNNDEKIHYLYSKISYLLLNVSISPELLDKLDEITFSDIDKEEEIIKEIYQSLTKQYQEFLCIKKDEPLTLVSAKFENGKYFVRNNMSYEGYEDKEFKEKYITLDDFFEGSKFIGLLSQNADGIDALYHNPKKGIILAMSCDEFFFVNEKRLYAGTFAPSVSLSIYNDPEYTKQRLYNFYEERRTISKKHNK